MAKYFHTAQFKNNREGFNLLSVIIKPFKIQHYFIDFESAGHYGDNLIRYVVGKDYTVGLINPLTTDAYRKNGNSKNQA
ncbi:hypothetical protein AOC36_06490 [Erysipelothrix larvae]|uniref:Transposase IS111A/IS1328/IS1533 N-terminal domain-containing protein n=1 Tax=Erysipelothrix larvae TaxID=1514105 RepID=A0A120JTQ8_9FIRM|nr:transposase [Erysipelothrix larvae]AMC93646.1 hypothetical protein AOC36_06490 [Erysipelothrix larvae]